MQTRSKRETEEWKKGDRVILSTKDLVFKKRPVWKLIERYVEPYVDREGSIIECGKITVTKFNENSSGSKCELNSSI